MTETILFVHGLASTHESTWGRYGWSEFAEELAYSPVGFELPGHGASTVSPDDDPAQLAALWACIEEYGARTAVGFSAGSMLLLRAATQRPSAFDRLVLTGVGDGIWNDGSALHRMGEALESGDTAGNQEFAFFERIARSAGNDPKRVGAYMRSTPRQPDASSLAAVGSEVLVVLGDQDGVGPADRLLDALPRASLEVLAGTGHHDTTADPKAFAAVERFLARRPVDS